MPRARDKYGVGSEVRWSPERPPRKKRPKAARKWRPRPPVQNPPRPKPVTCQSVTCPYLAPPVLKGRTVCEGCAERIDRRAAELRNEAKRRTVKPQSAPASDGTDPGHDRGVTLDG
jgi:hypothetical protein